MEQFDQLDSWYGWYYVEIDQQGTGNLLEMIIDRDLIMIILWFCMIWLWYDFVDCIQIRLHSRLNKFIILENWLNMLKLDLSWKFMYLIGYCILCNIFWKLCK